MHGTPRMLLAVGLSLLSLAGCGDWGRAKPTAPRQNETVRAVAVVPAEVRKQLLDGAIGVLRRLDDFD